MLTYHIPSDLKIPMYLYLYQRIKDDIENQILKANEKLPSKRNLSKNLHISLITVENAYNQLLLEGYIYSIEKKGYYVNQMEFPQHPIKTLPQIAPQKQIHFQVDLKTNSVSLEYFPFSIWAKLTRQILSLQSSALLTSPSHQGNLELREAISQHLYDFAGMNVFPEQIIIGAGTEYLYNLVIQLLGRDQIYALENPGHRSISKVYATNDVCYRYLNLDQFGIKIDELYQSDAHIVHISPAHHFPTGMTMPITRRLEILKWAKDNQGYIIEDDYDSEFRLRGHPLSPLFQIDHGEHVIYMNTFSKTLAPSFRMSYMVLPLHLVSVYREKLDFYACSVSQLEQMILAEFIKEGYFEKHINRMRNHYKNVRDTFLHQLYQSDIADVIEIKEENAGLHFLLKYKTNHSDEKMIEKAKRIGLNIASLSQFYDQPFQSSTFVINYSGLSSQDIPVAIKLLTQLLKDE